MSKIPEIIFKRGKEKYGKRCQFKKIGVYQDAVYYIFEVKDTTMFGLLVYKDEKIIKELYGLQAVELLESIFND